MAPFSHMQFHMTGLRGTQAWRPDIRIKWCCMHVRTRKWRRDLGSSDDTNPAYSRCHTWPKSTIAIAYDFAYESWNSHFITCFCFHCGPCVGTTILPTTPAASASALLMVAASFVLRFFSSSKNDTTMVSCISTPRPSKMSWACVRSWVEDVPLRLTIRRDFWNWAIGLDLSSSVKSYSAVRKLMLVLNNMSTC